MRHFWEKGVKKTFGLENRRKAAKLLRMTFSCHSTFDLCYGYTTIKYTC
jgi:hypothetical protein